MSKNLRSMALLILILVAFLGPWTFTQDGAPPPEWCGPRHMLLENGRCATLVSGAGILGLVGAIFVGGLHELATGNILVPDAARQILLSLGILLILLPPVFTLLKLRYGKDKRLQILSRLSWGLAMLPSMWIALFTSGFNPAQFWGIWLYMLLAAGTLLLSILGPRTRDKLRTANL